MKTLFKKIILALALLGTTAPAQLQAVKKFSYKAPKQFKKELESRKKNEIKQEVIQKVVKQFKKEIEWQEKQLELIKQDPMASLWGGINYAMTLDEMKEAIRKRFNNMKQKGLIISTKEFEKIKDNYFDVNNAPKPEEMGKYCNIFLTSRFLDLTRIWGIDYLETKIRTSEELSKIYAVPKYVIVSDNLEEIEVMLRFDINYIPVVIKLLNARIYFEHIKGSPATGDSFSFQNNQLYEKTGYYDFADAGNIIKSSKDGKHYIVDTEKKSFYENFWLHDKTELLRYAQKKFVERTSMDYTFKYQFRLD